MGLRPGDVAKCGVLLFDSFLFFDEVGDVGDGGDFADGAAIGISDEDTAQLDVCNGSIGTEVAELVR